MSNPDVTKHALSTLEKMVADEPKAPDPAEVAALEGQRQFQREMERFVEDIDLNRRPPLPEDASLDPQRLAFLDSSLRDQDLPQLKREAILETFVDLKRRELGLPARYRRRI